MKNYRLPRITIITPSLNQGQYIESTILSVINQDYPDLEYIIIDGGSTDHTMEIVNRYKSSISRVISEKDTGQTNAINKGLKLAGGEIINWLNSDDMLADGVLWTIGKYMLEYPAVDILYGKCNLIDGDNAITKVRRPMSYSSRALWVASTTLCQPVTFFRKTSLEKVGLLDEKLNFVMDQDLYVRFELAGMNFQKHPSLFGFFRIHEDSKSENLRLAMVKELDHVLDGKHRNPLPKRLRRLYWFWYRMIRFLGNLPGLAWFHLTTLITGKKYV